MCGPAPVKGALRPGPRVTGAMMRDLLPFRSGPRLRMMSLMSSAESHLFHGDEHGHAHLTRGRLFAYVYALSMVFGRGAMVRALTGLARLSAADVVVDVGCGPGSAIRQACKAGAARAVGVDPSPDMLRLARWITSARRMDRSEFVEGSAENLPLAAGSATVLWALQSVHHWEDRPLGVKEAMRVLGPGGRLILAERRVTPGARGHAAHGLTEQEAAQLAGVVGAAGFVDVETRAVRAGRRTLVAITAAAPA